MHVLLGLHNNCYRNGPKRLFFFFYKFQFAYNSNLKCRFGDQRHGGTETVPPILFSLYEREI